MAGSNDIQALEKIFLEVDESGIQIALSVERIKAQSALINKLIKRTAQQKEICNLISNGNIKQEAENKFVQQEINNLRIFLDTIKSGNTELRKELLLKKNQKIEILKRIEVGEQKYEDIWQSSKSRYESIPFVQICLQGKNKIQVIERNIDDLRNESAKFTNNINIKRNAIMNTDKKLVIDLANFIVIERPKIMKMISDKIIEIKKLTKKDNSLREQTLLISQLSKFKTNVVIKSNTCTEKTSQSLVKAVDSLTEKNNGETMMPKLHLLGDDFDVLRVKLEKIKNGDFNIEECKRSITEPNKTKDLTCNIKKEHDDIEVDKEQSRKIISKVNPSQLFKVDFITSEESKVDLSFENKTSQEKKKVTFDELMVTIVDDDNKGQDNQSNNITIAENKNDEVNNCQNCNSVDGDHSIIKDNMLKEYNLDSSSQFAYTKHSVVQKKSEDKAITSKFFNSKRDDAKNNEKNIETTPIIQETKQICDSIDSSKINLKNTSTEKIDQDAHKTDTRITGHQFSHGSQGMSDSLNLSDSITGFQDGDFPHCIDSSVLLSPKVDVLLEIGNNNIQNESEDLANFMSGLRKTVSLFKWSSPDCNTSTSTNEKTKENFNFNFNSEKKKRSGTFNMFRN